MKWEVENDKHRCQLSMHLIALVSGTAGKDSWHAEVFTRDGLLVCAYYGLPSPAAAKSAVAAWIGKTMAQLSNALAAGETYPDDGA